MPLQSPKRQTRTIFVEAKYNVAIKKEWQKFSDKTCNSSNLFRQLELKKIFLDAKKAQENRKNRNTSNVKSILDTDPRFTGYSKIVEKIVKGINCGRGQDYYLAIIKEYPDKYTMESVQKEFSKVCEGRFGIITWRELKELTRGQKLAYFNNTYNFNEVS